LAILHSLMRTRAIGLHNDHVTALNLVQLEFYGHEKIERAFRYYMEHLNLTVPSDPAALKIFIEDREDRFYSLVQEIAAQLEFRFDKSDLKRLSYSPRGWANLEAQQQGILARTLEMLDGRRPLISSSVPNSTTCPAGTPKKAAERSALRCKKANSVSRQTHIPGMSSLGMMVSRPM